MQQALEVHRSSGFARNRRRRTFWQLSPTCPTPEPQSPQPGAAPALPLISAFALAGYGATAASASLFPLFHVSAFPHPVSAFVSLAMCKAPGLGFVLPSCYASGRRRFGPSFPLSAFRRFRFSPFRFVLGPLDRAIGPVATAFVQQGRAPWLTRGPVIMIMGP
jgi:hypothetical protein